MPAFSRRFPIAYSGNGAITVGNGGDTTDLRAALSMATSGDTIHILGNTECSSSLTSALEVPDGVSIVGVSPESCIISMPSGTPTVPTIIFRGNNHCANIQFQHQTSAAGTEGGIMLCGSGHSFFNVWADGNQDCLMLGDALFPTYTDSLIGSASWTAATSTLTKTNAFSDYTWRSGDVVEITAGGTSGFYTISSRTDASNIVLGSSISGGDLAGTVTAIVNAQHHQWGGETEFRSCRFTGWNQDFLRVNGCLGSARATSPAVYTTGTGTQRLSFYDCVFEGKTTTKWIIEILLQTYLQGCRFRQPLGSFTIFGSGPSGSGANTGSAPTMRPTIAISGASSDVTGATITDTAGFANYHWRAGDRLAVDSGTGATVGTYEILTRPDNDTITVGRRIGGSSGTTGIGASATDVAGRIIPVYRFTMVDCYVEMATIPATAGFAASYVLGPPASSCGVQSVFDNVTLRTTLSSTTLFRGVSSANPVPQPSFTVRGGKWPEYLTLSTAGGATSAEVRFEGGLPRVRVFDDFMGPSGTALTAPWATQDTSAAGTPTLAFVNDVAAGEYNIAHSANDEVQTLTLYWGDQLTVDPTKRPVFEARMKINFAGANFSADQRIVMGLASARNATLDSVVSNAWFRIEGANLNILCETDDGTTDTDDKDTGSDIVDDTYLTLRIDMTSLKDIKFYVNGVLSSGGVMSATALTASTLLQPFIEIQKDAGTETESVVIDYVSVEWDRV